MTRATQFLAVAALAGMVSCQNAPMAEKAEVEAAAKAPAGVEKARTKVAEVEVPGDAAIHVSLDETLDTRRHQPGDTFTATLAEPVMAGERIAIPKGTRFTGHVTSAKSSGRLKGRGYLAVTLDSFELNGESYAIDTTSQGRSTGSHKKRNATLIGGGAGVGALIGAVAGGGKGAAIGAGTGAAAGTAGAAFTGKKDVTIPAETLLRFTLQSPVRIKT